MNFLRKIFSARGGSASGGKKKDKAPTEKKKEDRPEALGVLREDSKVGPGKIIAGVLRRTHVTEKSRAGAEENKYVFRVEPEANKIRVREAVESKYRVLVSTVRVLNTSGKERRRGKQIGWKPGYKKAMVTLKEGQTIEVQ